MTPIRLSESEMRFMKMIWNRQPVHSSVLVALCEEQFGWKKSTTYTMLKRLELKGAVKNENTIVKALADEDDVRSKESDRFVTEQFDGSLPKFIAAFLGDKKITDAEAEELKRLIDSYVED
ncbi:MAG: BlaI/MecI/CopY family transcriptional regulator [Oscillospiraceae bacterium]|nr:BlaI/MecI/CopY family transcriptional regulator [Oscillospiraceae bacterium]MBR2806409.1 BlaI/MecI/CopY family transcriptional regulator [Oscillospiraceae bacterium]